jgi:hypothetical protein
MCFIYSTILKNKIFKGKSTKISEKSKSQTNDKSTLRQKFEGNHISFKNYRLTTKGMESGKQNTSYTNGFKRANKKIINTFLSGFLIPYCLKFVVLIFENFHSLIYAHRHLIVFVLHINQFLV